MSNTFNIKRTETNGDGVALNSVAHARPTSKIDVIIDALSVAQNSVWSALNQEALAYAVELKLELAEPEQEPVCDKDPYLCGFVQCQLGKACKNTLINTIPTKIFGPNLEQILNAAGFYRREWVGLTDEEIKEVLDLNVAPWSLSGVALQHVMDDARALEAKLKEKNT